MPKISGGLLAYRRRGERLEVLLVHPGGPFWAKKDEGVWGIPKGELDHDGEDKLATAKREFEEETGFTPQGELVSLGTITQKGGKVVHAWAFEGDFDLAKFKSNTFRMEWPPKSGEFQEFPEVDRAEYFAVEEARKRINPAQVRFLDALERWLQPPS